MSISIQGSKSWLSMRQSKIGASDASAIMGVSKWNTPFSLWEQKLGLREVEMNSAMKRGTDMEEEARREFEHLKDVSVFPDVVFHPDFDWMMASLDGIDIERKVMVEIKCVNRIDHQTALNGSVPDHYYPQCQHQLAVTGLPFMYYFSYDPLNPATVIVYRDDKYIKDMIKKEKEFYRCMMEFDPPPFSDKDYHEMEGFEWETSVKDYLNALKMKKFYESQEDVLKNKLKELSLDRNVKGCGIKMTKFTRKGNVQYDKVPALQGIDLEIYRNKPTTSWRITEYDTRTA